MDAAAAPAAQAANGGRRRLLQARGAVVDAGRLAVACSFLACMAALTAPVYTPTVVGAVLAGVVTLSVGVWVSTEGRGGPGIGLVNLCFSFLALVVGVAQGGNFDPELLLKMYNGLAD